jgi:hypothetical protein
MMNIPKMHAIQFDEVVNQFQNQLAKALSNGRNIHGKFVNNVME